MAARSNLAPRPQAALQPTASPTGPDIVFMEMGSGATDADTAGGGGADTDTEGTTTAESASGDPQKVIRCTGGGAGCLKRGNKKCSNHLCGPCCRRLQIGTVPPRIASAGIPC